MFKVRALAVGLVVLLAAEALGQSRPATKDAPLDGFEKLCVTQHELKLGDGAIRYRAAAGLMQMKDEAGKLKATVFFVAYEKDRGADGATDRAADPTQRPIMFVFNGGPGAASVWLHLGTAGPRRVALSDDGSPSAPPYRLTDNAATWLTASDLVFVDPVGTGYSRPAAGEAREQFHGVQEDIRWVGEFIRLFLTRHQRWASPKFLAGESYGATRVAGLAAHLLDRHGIALNGVVLISGALEFATLSPSPANDLPYALFVPSYAAVAFHHRKLADDLQKDLAATLKEAQDWAMGDYLVALARGASLPADQRQKTIHGLCRFTSLRADYLDKANLRIGPSDFEKQLLAASRQIVGRFDGRIVGPDPQPTASWPSYDPSLSGYLPVYGSSFNDYVRRTLGFESDLPYEVLTSRVHPWNFGQEGMAGLSMSGELCTAMAKNPHMKVLFANGWFDLATPWLGARYTTDHMDLAPALRANLSHAFYPAGHMMYHEPKALQKLGDDVRAFVAAAKGKP
jgi:carboxypeptidase C (cathepsin A)